MFAHLGDTYRTSYSQSNVLLYFKDFFSKKRAMNKIVYPVRKLILQDFYISVIQKLISFTES